MNKQLIAVMLAVILICTGGVCAQQAKRSSDARLAFDVVSVKPNKAGEDKLDSNVPLGAGDVFTPTHGVFRATGFPLIYYIQFAYRITPDQQIFLRAEAPKWVLTERYAIEAKTLNENATKDELRLMMRTVLAERSHLLIREQDRQVPVYQVELIKPGRTGPYLRPHDESTESCTGATGIGSETPSTGTLSFPKGCGGFLWVPPTSAGLRSGGARKVSMQLVASSIGSMSGLGRPFVDKTGIDGEFDFSFEFAAEPSNSITQENVPIEGPSFSQAIKDELGLKLEKGISSIPVWHIDDIGRPSEN